MCITCGMITMCHLHCVMEDHNSGHWNNIYSKEALEYNNIHEYSLNIALVTSIQTLNTKVNLVFKLDYRHRSNSNIQASIHEYSPS